MFSSGEYKSRSGEYTFCSCERTFSTAEFKLKAYCMGIDQLITILGMGLFMNITSLTHGLSGEEATGTSFCNVFLCIANYDTPVVVAYSLTLQIVCRRRCCCSVAIVSDACYDRRVRGEGVEVVGNVVLVIAYIVENDAAYNIVDENVDIESCSGKAVLNVLYDDILQERVVW